MVKTIHNKKGVLLVIAILVLVVISILTAVYLSRLVTEKRSFDSQAGRLQAINLAEAGASLAMAELNKRTLANGDINLNLAGKNATQIKAYVDSIDPLGFLRDYATNAGGPAWAISGNQATLNLTFGNLNGDVAGNGSAVIKVVATSNPVNDGADGPYRFYYKYWIESTGNITRYNPAISKTIAYSPNTFNIVVRRDNFAKFALFTSHHRTPSGDTVWFTADTNFYGPVHTNERFSFANNPSAHFTDEVSQHQNTARYYNNNSAVFVGADTNPACCEESACPSTPCIDKPQFDKGFALGEDIINLPSSITQTELRNQALGTMGNPSSRGVYVPNQSGQVTGGIFIRGNQGQSSDDASINMQSSGNNAVYTIGQTLSGINHTTVVTVDMSARTTTVRYDGGTPVTYGGIPDGVRNDGILIYADDSIKALSGTVQKDTAITVSSERDIVITNHILYEQYSPSPLEATGYTNMLGVLAWGGNVRIGPAAPNNLQIHGIVMAHNGIFTVDNYDSGSPRGFVTLLGGVITDFYGPFGQFTGGTMIHGYGRNFVYDSRVLNGQTPPYFPFLEGYAASVMPSDVFSTRTTWREK